MVECNSRQQQRGEQTKMKNFTDYIKGGNKGCIMESNEGIFTAVTAVKSKDFKTLKGAEKFMVKNEYVKVGA